MPTATSTINATRGQVTGNPLIESDRVEGTTIYDMNGTSVGSVKRLMIDKLSGKVAYTVASFGGFLGIGTDRYPLPWSLLDYDIDKGGYEVPLDKAQLESAPRYSDSTCTLASKSSPPGSPPSICPMSDLSDACSTSASGTSS